MTPNHYTLNFGSFLLDEGSGYIPKEKCGIKIDLFQWLLLRSAGYSNIARIEIFINFIVSFSDLVFLNLNKFLIFAHCLCCLESNFQERF